MKDKLTEDILLKASIASISNHESYNSGQGKRGLIYMIKYMIWYSLLVFIAPYKSELSDKFICAMTPNNYKRLKDFCHVDECFTFARLNSDLKRMRKNKSILSPFHFFERIRITVNAISFYLRNREKLKGYIHFIMEYYAIAEYMIKFKPKQLISPGMYDRYCTLLTYLAKEFEIESIGVQDGAAIDIKVPYKVYCNKMYAFDEFEAATIKKFILNNDCEYILTGFVSYLNWKTYNKGSKKVIAVASQDWFTKKAKKLIRTLATSLDFDKYELVVYPHYREKQSQYDDIVYEFPQIKVITEARHSNIDILITFYSTIVYDFWSVNSSLSVICLHINGFEANYYNRENVKVFNTITELTKYIINIVY